MKYLYHLPNWRTIGVLVWQRSLSLEKAGTTILSISIVVWALSMLPGGSLQTSYLAQLGHWVEPVGRWIGLVGADGRAADQFMAKENAIATLGVFGSGGAAWLSSWLPPPPQRRFPS
jgi:ferrous iron transport protein B